MPDSITHKNKDVMFKVLSQHYQDKSLAVYGLNLPKIKQLLPSDYPAVTATEIYADNVFLLEDDSLLILEYESDPKQDDFLKYNSYVINALRRLRKGSIIVKKVIIAVIYTGDIKTYASEFDIGALRIRIEQVFLSRFDTNEMYSEMIKEWIRLTKVARLFEEEKVEAVNAQDKYVRKQIVMDMLTDGEDILKIMKYSKLTRAEIEEVQASTSI